LHAPLAAAALGLPRVDRLIHMGGQNLFSQHAGLFWCVRVATNGKARPGKQRKKENGLRHPRGEVNKRQARDNQRIKNQKPTNITTQRTQMPVVAFFFFLSEECTWHILCRQLFACL